MTRVYPYGPALNSTDEELGEAVEIRAEDIALALAWLRLYAPELAFMVEAEPFDREETAPLAYMAGLLAGGTRYLYLTQRGVYFDIRRRRAVDPQEVRRLLDRALDRGSQGARNLTLQLAGQPARGADIGRGIVTDPRLGRASGAGRRLLDLRTWELAMRQSIKQSTVAAHLSGSGGVKRTHIDALARMQKTVENQYEFLRRYAQQIETGEQPIDGRAQARSAAYIQSARAAHMAARDDVAKAVGLDQMRNILYPGDSCEGCVEMEALGWIDIDDERWIPVGKRECRSNCRCDVAYREAATGREQGAA